MSKLEIFINDYKDSVGYRANWGQGLHTGDLHKVKGIVDPDYLFNWLLCELKPSWNFMPFDTINVHVIKPHFEKHKKTINMLGMILDRTNNAIEKYDHLSSDGGGSLFANVSDDIRYMSLYKRLKTIDPNLYYENLDLGFDRENRQWKQSDPSMTLDEFLNFLAENNIGKVFTINSYWIEKYIEISGVFIVPVLQRMGVKLIAIDNDPPDLRPQGHLHRVAYLDESAPRFSNLSILNEHWDKKYKTCVTYVGIPMDYKTRPMKEIDENYRVVVLSNSRWDSVQPLKKSIDPLLENLENPWTDLTPWYLAMREHVLGKDLCDYNRFIKISLLHQLFFMAAQDIKFKVVSEIKTDRTVEVYGDVGWKNVCPDIYCGSLDNQEIEQLFGRENDLFLLFNLSYSYLDASGPVYDMVMRGVPFCNIPPSVISPDLKRLEAIEYSNPKELNRKIKDFRPYYDNAIESIEFYRQTLDSSVKQIDSLLNGRSKVKADTRFYWHLNDHKKAYKDLIETRFDIGFLNACYGMFG
jgi:hypothetical protein